MSSGCATTLKGQPVHSGQPKPVFVQRMPKTYLYSGGSDIMP